jgi:predicted Zn-dependent protease
LVWMGYVMREEGRREESIEYFRRAIASDPDNMTARAHLSFTMEDDGQSDAAVATLREALAFAPDHAELHHAMSDVSLRQGRYADALLHGRRAQEGAPNSMYFRAAHAWALANLDRLEEAEQVVRDGLELSPDAPGLNAQLAGIAALRGDHATVRMATEAETDPQSRRQLQALVAVMEGDDAALDARIEALLGNCQTRRVHCLQAAASLRASAGHTKALYALLDHLEQEPAYRAALGDPVFRPYYTDPRYLRHLEKYGRSPPSPVSQDNAPH